MEKKLTALVVDDEEKAVKLLCKLLADTLRFREIRSASSADDALREFEQYQPDLIFLDIKMPGKDGITFFRELDRLNVDASIVVVTAFDKFAIQAINNHAIGYLLKPVNREELDQCITYYVSKARRTDPLEKLGRFLESLQVNTRIRFNTRNGYFYLEPSEILYCAADGNYAYIHTIEREHFCSLQLGVIQNMLPKNGFIRLGRSLIINMRHLVKVDRKGKVIVFTRGGDHVPLTVSMSQLKELDKIGGHEF